MSTCERGCLRHFVRLNFGIIETFKFAVILPWTIVGATFFVTPTI
jgi:hypothetical protein